MFEALRKERIVAAAGFNRWRVPPASISIHLCIGSVYAWSIFNPPLTKLRGVATSSADDWTLGQVVWVFSVAIATLGITAAIAGKWLERVGPRMVGVTAACCYGGGFALAGLAISLQQLWLLYLGYGIVAGAGLGLGYVSPVSTLIKWFPDRRGMATGMAIMGFGGGAIIAAPLEQWLVARFHRLPDYLGPTDAVALVTEGGRRLASVGGELREVVVVGANEVAAMTVPADPGVYVVGTGNAGVAETFFVLAAAYFCVMMIASFAYRVPPEGWRPAGWTPPSDDTQAADKLITRHDVEIDEAMRTPQFWQLWVLLCFNVTAGIGVLGVAKTMMTEIFGRALPAVVDGAFAATYVLMISVFNMIGRFAWSSLSDPLGRKRMYTIFFAAGACLYLSIPWIAAHGSTGAVAWLIAFYAVTMLVFTMYGGGFATFPAYLADIFGSKYVGGIHGRALTAWSLAGVLGPVLLTNLRARAEAKAIGELAAMVEPARFTAAFGSDPSQLDALVAAKSVTIAKLMDLVPPGTPDPSSGLYDSTMILMAVLLAIALVVNLRVKPVDPRHYAERTSATRRPAG
ncbi:MAG: OFA family MFS transporter [Nannocystaceae bacterium]|nr:OFA family MFS transporter [Nannocystaceae bacterium]